MIRVLSVHTRLKERGMIFTGESVRSIYEGRKTMTRRIVKPQPYWIRHGQPVYDGAFLEINEFGFLIVNDIQSGHALFPMGENSGKLIRCPYGVPGDRLWVKETWGEVWMREIGQFIYKGPRIPDRKYITYKSGRLVRVPNDNANLNDPESWTLQWRDDYLPKKWKSPIFMPRWASRGTLEITDVKVERVQEISTEDIHSEGIDRWIDYEGGRHVSAGTARMNFLRLWNSIHGPDAWERNDWVWAISFRRLP